jgi:hypothetical protein
VRYLLDECPAKSQLPRKDSLRLAAYFAAENGHLDIVKYLVEAWKADPMQAQDGLVHRTVAGNGHLAVLKYLIEECKADPRAEGDGALVYAARGGHLAVVKYLIENHHADPHVENDLPMRWAAGYGQLEMVKYLVEERHADPTADKDDALFRAVDGGAMRVVAYLAGRIFERDIWRGKSQTEMEAEGQRLFDEMHQIPWLSPENDERARKIILRCFQLLINQPDADSQRADMVARRLDHPGCYRQRLLF